MQKEESREFCFSLFEEYTKSKSLIKHGLAVEACMLEYAEFYGENKSYWGNVGLLHDFDYEMFPTQEEHPYKGAEILRGHGFEDEFVDAILSHTPYTGVPRTTLMRKVLFACDELAGFIIAVIYVRPSKNIDGLEVKSVMKKLKDKAFARAVSRNDIFEGVGLLEINLEEHISRCILALTKNRANLEI